MPRDINDIYTLPAGNPVVPGTTIETSWANNTLNDIAQALTDSLDKSDPARARNILGLGTAATKDSQTNRNDTTAGALMINGAHGLGDSSPPLITDLDARTITGFIREAGATGSPAGGAATSGIHIGGANADLALQILARLSGDRIWWRRKNITWAPWMELFHSAAACLLTVDTASLGFGTGSGGAVTQATSKATAVTLNKPSGRITLNASALAAGASVTFQLLNTSISANDTVSISPIQLAALNYRVEVARVAAGACFIRITNITGGSLSETFDINFSVMKGATA